MMCAGVQQAKTMPWMGSHIGLHELDYRGVMRLLVATAQYGAGNATRSAGFTIKKG